MRAVTIGLIALTIPALGLRAQDSTVSIVYLPNQVDQMPRRLSGPTLDYPPGVLKTDGARVLIEAIFDTTGHIEPGSFRIVETADTAMNQSVRATLLATTYAPAVRKGKPVRFLGQLWLVLHTRGGAGGPVDATALISAARRLPASQLDSALKLIDQALDSSAHASDGERTYGLLERGVVEHRMGRSASATTDIQRGLDLWRLEHARGVELAPFLNDLADSIRLTAKGARAVATGDHLVVLGPADVAPALLSRPPLVYPPEARSLGVTGTVTVEADVDSTGRVSGAPKVVESPNPILNDAAVRIVQASRYRPAQLRGHPVSVRIRQPITFRP
jgi:TonB family protein